MRPKLILLALIVSLAACSIGAPLILKAGGAAGSSWKSFELIYYDPAAKPNTLSQFDVDPTSEFTTDMRIDYLRRYAHALEERAGANNPKFFAFDVVTTEAARERAAQIKEKPRPEIRQVVPLKYWQWKLEPEPEAVVRDMRWEARDFPAESTWNAMEAPRMFAFNRAAWLRTHFQGPKGKRVLLSVGSIIDEFEIWVNGRYVVRHSGFEPVTLDLTPFSEEGVDNTLALRIENKPQDQIGIADEISIIGVSDPYLSDLFVKTDRAEGREADATLEVEATQTQTALQPALVSVKVQITPWFPEESPKSVFSRVIPLQLSGNGTKKASVPVHLPDVDLWSPDAPHLYLVKATLLDASGNAGDDLVEVIGFRRIEQRQGRIFLNGHPWFMKSFGETLGFAPGFDFMGNICPPDEWVIRDFMLAKKANANMIRMHPWGFRGDVGKYTDTAWPVWGLPNSSTNYQRIAWIADQLGIGLFWGTRVWTLWGVDFQNKYAFDNSWQARLEPSLRHVRNRPSILVYEGLNEVGATLAVSAEKTRGALEQQYEKFCQRYFDLVNSIDDSRLVIPDTYWGGLAHSSPPDHPYVAEQPSPFHPLKLYTYVENTFWTDHNYYGWYRNLLQRPLLEKVQARPFVQMESGGEAMPDWNLYRGLRWDGIWLNNGGSSGGIEQARLGRPLRILQDSEVNVSQANQGLSIMQTVFATRFSVADGININLIADGLAEANYHKGVCDIYRKAKLGFFAAQMAYEPLVAAGAGFDFVLGSGDPLHVQVAADSALWGKPAQLTLEVVDESGSVVDRKEMPFTLDANQRVTSVGDYVPRFGGKGYYFLQYTVTGQ